MNRRPAAFCLIPLLLLALIPGIVTPLQAADDGRYTEAHRLVEDSTITLKEFAEAPLMQSYRDLVRRSRAVLVIPQLLRGGLVLGGSGGNGVLLVRNMEAGTWSGPAFYTIGSVSFGLQVGAETSRVVMVILTDKGLRSLLTSPLKLGVDVTIAAGPLGAGTKTVAADILAYSISRGIFGGFTVEGALIQALDGWNADYYQRPLQPSEIVFHEEVRNHHADQLQAVIGETAAPTSRAISY